MISSQNNVRKYHTKGLEQVLNHQNNLCNNETVRQKNLANANVSKSKVKLVVLDFESRHWKPGKPQADKLLSKHFYDF